MQESESGQCDGCTRAMFFVVVERGFYLRNYGHSGHVFSFRGQNQIHLVNLDIKTSSLVFE